MPTASKALATLDFISAVAILYLPRPNATSASTVGITTCKQKNKITKSWKTISFYHLDSEYYFIYIKLSDTNN